MNVALDVEQARFNMVEQQIRTWDVLNQEILDLLYVVRRENFVPEAYRCLAFSDLEIPIGKAPGERMWAPKVEARVLQELALKKTDHVLEIGTGSGYFAALMAHRASRVYSVEINSALAEYGKSNINAAVIDNVSIECGDASHGWAFHAPYDVIVLTSSVPVIPEKMFTQLKSGGRLFAIVGDEPVMTASIFHVDSTGSIKRTDLFETCMPPLVNALQPERFIF